MTSISQTYHPTSFRAVQQGNISAFKHTALDKQCSAGRLSFQLASKRKVSQPRNLHHAKIQTKRHAFYLHLFSWFWLYHEILFGDAAHLLNFTDLLSLFIHLEITVPRKVHIFSLGPFLFYFLLQYLNYKLGWWFQTQLFTPFAKEARFVTNSY